MFAFSVQTQKILKLNLWIKLWLLKCCVHQITASRDDCNSYSAPSSFGNFPEFFRMKESVTFIFVVPLRDVYGPCAELAPAEPSCEVPIQYLTQTQQWAELAGRRGWAQGWTTSPIPSAPQVPRSGLEAGLFARRTCGTMSPAEWNGWIWVSCIHTICLLRGCSELGILGVLWQCVLSLCHLKESVLRHTSAMQTQV